MKTVFWVGGGAIAAMGAWVLAAPGMGRSTGEERFGSAPPGRVAEDTRTPERIAEDRERAAEQVRAAGEAAVKARAAAEAPPPESHWYEGGTLHQANGLEWQQAAFPNKLATASDLLAKLWMAGKLKPRVAAKVHAVDDLRGPSSELVEALDRAFEKKADAKLNRQLYANQKVSEIAVVVLAMMGWV